MLRPPLLLTVGAWLRRGASPLPRHCRLLHSTSEAFSPYSGPAANLWSLDLNDAAQPHADSVAEDVVNQIVAEQGEDQMDLSEDPSQGRKGPRP
ncbi:unnamed protein product [Urochloa humidicola]